MIKDYELIASFWTLLSLTFTLVCLRLYFRVYLRRIWHWSDIFITAAWLFSLSLCIQQTMKYRIGWLSTNEDDPDAPPDIPLSAVIEGFKINYATGTMYFLCLYLVKVSMLCFYNELMNRDCMPRTWIALRVLGGFVVVCWIFSVSEFLFYCKNISDNWRIDRENRCPGVGFDVKMSSAIIALHLFTDVLIYLFPILILRRLTLPKRQKIGVCVLFFIGFLSVANAFIYFYLCFYQMQLGLWIELTAMWEQTSAITIACCPAFKALIMTKVLPEFKHFWRSGKGFWSKCPEDGDASSPGNAPKSYGSPLDGANNQVRRNSPAGGGARRPTHESITLSDLSSPIKSTVSCENSEKPQISQTSPWTGKNFKGLFSDPPRSRINESHTSSNPSSPATSSDFLPYEGAEAPVATAPPPAAVLQGPETGRLKISDSSRLDSNSDISDPDRERTFFIW